MAIRSILERLRSHASGLLASRKIRKMALLAAIPVVLVAVVGLVAIPSLNRQGAPAHPAGSEAALAAPPVQISPEAALGRLKEGNARFRSGTAEHPDQDEFRRQETARRGQAPFAAILGCSDSRVPCELVFDAGIGDLFVVRVAGNVCDADEAGSIEYAAEHLGVPLLVVLGHEKCGAVTAVASGGDLFGSLPQLLDNIVPAVTDARRLHPGLDTEDLVPFALRANVVQSMEDLLRRSEIVRHLVSTGRLVVVGAVYDLASGEVTWIGEHPREVILLKGGDTAEAGERSGQAAHPSEEASAADQTGGAHEGAGAAH